MKFEEICEYIIGLMVISLLLFVLFMIIIFLGNILVVCIFGV